MRRQTQWALGGVLAGTVLLGVTGTLAAFSDTEQTSATVGASSLDLQVTSGPGGPSFQVGPDANHVAMVSAAAAGGSGELTLSIDGTEGDCRDLPPALVTITAPTLATPVTVSACGLRGDGVPIGRLDPASAAVPVVVGMVGRTAGPGAANGQTQWQGQLRLTLTQDDGGFTDTATVDVHLVAPNGTGQGNGQGHRP